MSIIQTTLDETPRTADADLPLLTAEQQRLVDENLDLVEKEAAALSRSIPPSFHDGLVGSGYLGLVAAAKNFDPTLGYSFRNYASSRVRGKMIDEAHKESELSKHASARHRDQWRIEERRALGQQLSETLERAAAYLERSPPLDFKAARRNELPAGGPSPESRVHAAWIAERIRAAAQQLETREREFVRQVYFEERQAKDVAPEIGLRSKFAASRLHAKILRELADKLKPRKP